MRIHTRIPAALALTLALAIPALAQTQHQQHATGADAAKTAPAVDADKVALLHEEYVAKTAELRGKITARQAELETLLVTKPGEEAAIKKLVAEISALRGTLYEQTTLFRLRFAKEAGVSLQMTRGMDGLGGHHGMGSLMGPGRGGMSGPGMDCMKGMMMDMGKGAPLGPGMDMPAPAVKPDDAAKAPGDKNS